MFSFLRRLRADRRGTSVIELAIIAPVLSLVTMGIIDLSNGYARRLELTEAVDGTIERISAGNFEISGTTTGLDFDAYIADAAAAAKVPEEQVSVAAWRECDGVEQTDFDGSCPSDQIMARYVQVSIEGSFEPMFATVFAPGPDGTYPLHAEAAVRIQ